VVCGLSSLQPVSMADWGAVISVSRHMTQTCADRQEDTSRLSRPVSSVALGLLTGLPGLDRRWPCTLWVFML
jgi:hypothetical protein